MEKRNKVFIATSIDGYIADKDGGIDWLSATPNPEQLDLGYNAFINGVDAVVMGRNTFETICGFNMDWHFKIPVFVISRTLTSVPPELIGKVELVQGPITEILEQIHQKGYYQLYIDGGRTINGFLEEDLIDDLILTTIPTVLGDGIPLFSVLPAKLDFTHIETNVLLGELVQRHYRRKR